MPFISYTSFFPTYSSNYSSNWLVDFFSGHAHCTVYRDQTSTLKSINASIIQGSAIGPAAYVVNAGDLHSLTPNNQLVKFADDTYLIIPASTVDSRSAEVDNIETWASTNNLTLNRTKTKRSSLSTQGGSNKHQVAAPPALPGIVCVTSLNILGVTMTNGLSASDHVRGIISDCAQTLYALRVLRAHGMCDAALQASRSVTDEVTDKINFL